MLNTKPMEVVFCLPGSTFTSGFLKGWTALLSSVGRYNIIPYVSMGVSSNVYFVREMCVSGDTTKGPDQKPFNGSIDYDYMMWIDSDQDFVPEQFFQLLSHKKDIVSGTYMTSNQKSLVTVEHCDDEYFKKNGTYQFMTPDDMSKKSGLFEVDYTGFGFMLVKRGVFESIGYPYFIPSVKDIGDGIQDISSEDVSWCFRVREKGYKIWVDPSVRVGHQKRVTL